MSIISYLLTDSPHHLFTLSNVGTSTNDDLGDSPLPTRIIEGDYSFETDPVCYGVTHCIRSENNASTGKNSAVFDNRRDINNSGTEGTSYDWANNSYEVYFWARQKNIWNVTCMYEQGGQTNNLAFMGGPRCSFQAADAGQPFLITTSNTLSIKDRAILHTGGWEYYNWHAGDYNRIWYAENGIVQGFYSEDGTDTFPGHGANITIGNSADKLRSFNDTNLNSESVAQDSNFLGFNKNKAALTLSEGDEIPFYREFFERTVLPEVLIVSDTVANQQTQLDTLSGTVYAAVNCAIEIRQATNATDYTLNLNNIKFIQNENLKDIAVKYVGPNELTLVNLSGSNAEIVAVPAEQDLNGTTVLTGGGSIVIETPSELTVKVNQVGADVIVMEAGTDTVLASIDANSSNDFVFTYTGSQTVDVGVIKQGFIVKYTYGYNLTGDNQTLPVALLIDRAYQ